VWTNENHGRYDRSKLRYPSDVTDEEWTFIRPLIPPAKRGGNKRTVNEREVVNGLMYILSTGCQWVSLPKDLPPRTTVNDYFRHWDYDGTLDRIHHALYVKCRELAARDACAISGRDEETARFNRTKKHHRRHGGETPSHRLIAATDEPDIATTGPST
jgi:putative transposase